MREALRRSRLREHACHLGCMWQVRLASKPPRVPLAHTMLWFVVSSDING